VGAVVRCPANAVGNISRRSPTFFVEHFHRHETRAERDAGDAKIVVRRLRNGPRDVRAVPLIVVRMFVAGDEVPSGHALGRVEIRAFLERAVIFTRDARIDDGNGYASPNAEVPRSFRVDAVHVPLLFRLGVVRDKHRVNFGEWLGVFDARISCESGEYASEVAEYSGDNLDAGRLLESCGHKRKTEIGGEC
jgi:hypothetical protein